MYSGFHIHHNSCLWIINKRPKWRTKWVSSKNILHSKLYYSLYDLLSLLQPGGKWMISSLSKKREMGVNSQFLSKHWDSLWMGSNHTDQIYSVGGGGWGLRWNSEAEKDGEEGEYILKRLVYLMMCASCNHPFKCRHWRGVLTDVDRGDKRSPSRRGTLRLRFWRCLCFWQSRCFCLLTWWTSTSEQHHRSGNVTDWCSRWTVKIKRMTNKHAAYTALGANPPHPSPPPGFPFEDLLPWRTRRQWQTTTATGRTHNSCNKCDSELMAGPQPICIFTPKAAAQ